MHESQEILVSLIVPTYNVENYARMCFDSLINQTLKNIEIILVDDGSTDSSGIICDEYARRDSRIVVIHQDNVGLGLSRNSGIKIAKGKYIGFVDSDDCVSLEMFEVLYRNAQRYSADISYCSYSRFSTNDEIHLLKKGTNDITVYKGKEDLYDYLLNRIGMPPESNTDKNYGAMVWNGIYSRRLFIENNLMFVSERKLIAEDIIFDIDIIPNVDCIVHCDQKLYYYRMNENSLTGKYKKDRFESNVILCQEELKRKMELLYPKEKCFNAISRYFLTTARVAIIQEVEFSSVNGKKKAIQNIRRICNNKYLHETIEKYNYKLLPLKYRVTCYLIKTRNASLLWLMYKVYFKKKKLKQLITCITRSLRIKSYD